MCIRDSPVAGQGLQPVLPLIRPAKAGVQTGGRIAHHRQQLPAPVSYTHLPLLKKVYIPKYIFPLEKCCFAMVNCVFSFVALLLVIIFTGAPFHLTLLEALYPLITLFFFSLGVGLFLAAATVFFRDIMHIWSCLLYTSRCV